MSEVLARPVELADNELDAVAAGALIDVVAVDLVDINNNDILNNVTVFRSPPPLRCWERLRRVMLSKAAPVTRCTGKPNQVITRPALTGVGRGLALVSAAIS
jgi:hypothetical protein